MPSHVNPVNWFEIPVSDLARAKTFYETILGLEVTISEMGPNQMGFFPLDREIFRIGGALVLGEGYEPSLEGTLVSLNVDAIDPTLEMIGQSGGKTLLPRTSIGEHGFIAQFKDTEGNRVALHELPSLKPSLVQTCSDV